MEIRRGITENTPMLETKRLILRQFVETDLQDFFAIMNDEEVNTYLPWFPTQTLAQAEKMLYENFLKYYEKKSAYRYALCLCGDNRPIGYICLGEGDSYDFGYGLGREFWRKGLMTEGAAAVLRRIQAAGIPYITATHDKNNSHSGRVMQRLGMQYQYSYEERWQPKDRAVVFRLYQLNFDGSDFVYNAYREQYKNHFVEKVGVDLGS